MRKGGTESANTLPKEKQKTGGGTEQKKVLLHWNFSDCLYGDYTWRSRQEKANSYCLSGYEQSVQ